LWFYLDIHETTQMPKSSKFNDEEKRWLSDWLKTSDQLFSVHVNGKRIDRYSVSGTSTDRQLEQILQLPIPPLLTKIRPNVRIWNQTIAVKFGLGRIMQRASRNGCATQTQHNRVRQRHLLMNHPTRFIFTTLIPPNCPVTILETMDNTLYQSKMTSNHTIHRIFLHFLQPKSWLVTEYSRSLGVFQFLSNISAARWASGQGEHCLIGFT